MGRLKEKPDLFDKPVFEKLFSIAEYSNLTKEEKLMYDNSQKYRWDNKNVLDYARETGMLEGEKKRSLDFARDMKIEGYPIDKILKLTRLSVAEIEEL